MPEPVRGLSSMATKQLLADLSEHLRRGHALSVRFESRGGADVVRDIRAGAEADLVVVGTAALAALAGDGLVDRDTVRPLFRSHVVAAVAEDAEPIALSSEQDLRDALVGAGRIAYSTGPSGAALLDLVQRWGIDGAVRAKLVQAEPGTPVGDLLRDGTADLGFQQLSELRGLPGVRVLGPLPGAAAVRSTFGGAVLTRSARVDAGREVLRLLASNEAAPLVLAAGMEPD